MGAKQGKDGKFIRSKVAVEDRKPSTSFQNELERGVIAPMSEDLALIYAKLLSVGCPPVRGVLYCIPYLNETESGRETAKGVASRWMADALVLDAITSINGGKWHELPAEKRFQLALDKHNSEVAFYLWTTNFSDVEHREGLDKMKQARDVLKGLLGQSVDDADPMAAFARFAMELARNAQASQSSKGRKPPQIQGPDALFGKPS